MSDVNDVLLALRDVGVRQLPETGDAADRRVQDTLKREMAGNRSRRPAWTRHRIRVGGFAVPPAVLLAVAATAAAATTAAIAVTATNLFQINPQGDANGIESVVPSTVREVGSVAVPDYGTVQFWAATTQQRGFCFALKLPDGSWGGFPVPTTQQAADAQLAADGWDNGTPPGCVVTRQQEVVQHEHVAPGQQPTGLMKEPLEAYGATVTNQAGQRWDIYFGFVTANGTATSIHDPVENVTTPVMSNGYFILAEPTPNADQIPGWTAHPTRGPATPANTPENGADVGSLQVLNAAGQQLQPDYTYGSLLPGYTWGPSTGSTSPSS